MGRAGDLGSLLEPLVVLAREAGTAVMQVYASDFVVHGKDDASPVTEADLRAEAMLTKSFGPVDAMKSALAAAGVDVRMSKAGIELVPGPGYDAAALERLS